MNIDSLWEKISAVSAPMRSEGFELHFPVAAPSAFFHLFSEKCCILLCKIARGFSPSRTQKNRTPQKRCPVFLVRPEGFEPPTF